MHYTNNLCVINALLAACANVNARNACGKAPLHYVRLANIFEVLISAGADVNAQDNKGNTPLHDAQDARDKELEAFLQTYAT